MPAVDTEKHLEETTLKLFDALGHAETLGRIENLLFLIAALLGAIAILLFLQLRRESDRDNRKAPDWQGEVERAYDKGDYETALDILETYSLQFPGSAVVSYWRGRCYFQAQDWEKAAATFEDLLRSEPNYRQSVKDYMAFIELNKLASGVDGYVDNKE